MKKLIATTAIAIAMIGTATFACAEHHGRPHDGPPPHVEEALAKLPKDKAELVRNTFKSLHESRKSDWEQFKKNREEMKALLVADKFDKAAYMAKAKEVDVLHSAKKLKFHETMAELAEKLTVEERKILQEAMPGKRPHGGKHGHHGPRPEGKGAAMEE